MKPICPLIQLLIVDELPEAGQTFSIMFNARLFEIVILRISLSLPRVASTLSHGVNDSRKADNLSSSRLSCTNCPKVRREKSSTELHLAQEGGDGPSQRFRSIILAIASLKATRSTNRQFNLVIATDGNLHIKLGPPL